MDLYRTTGIGRAIDPRYPSNLFALAAAGASGLAWGIWKLAVEGDWGAALLRAAVAGAATFLAWALGRELDPDRPWVAGVAAVAAASIIGAGVPSLLVAGAVLLAVRVTARTTGRAPAAVDLVVLAGLAVAAAAGEAGFMAGLVLAAAVAADRWLPRTAPGRQVWVGALAAAAAVAAAAVWGSLGPMPGLPSGPEWVVAPVAVLALAALGRPSRVQAVGDFSGAPLSLARVRWGRAAAAAAGLLTFLWLGGPGLTAASAVWAALAASALPGRPGRG